MGAAALRIFAVENEALVLMQLQAVVSAAGHQVVATAMSGQEAIGAADYVDADIALVDLHLRDGLTGMAVGRHLTRIARIPVVYVTASWQRIPAMDGWQAASHANNRFDQASSANDAGGDYGDAIGIIAKPYTIQGVSRALAYLADRLRCSPLPRDRPASLFITPAYEARWASSA